MQLQDILILVGSILLGLVLIIGAFFLIRKKGAQTQGKTTPSPIDVDMLVKALGGLTNLDRVSLEQKRLRVLLHNPKLVSSGLLKTLEISAFLTGKEIKLLIKNDPLTLKKQIDSMIGEK